MKWYDIAIIILLIPVVAYLREALYSRRGLRKPLDDIADLWQNLREKRKGKYNHLNGHRDNETRDSESGTKTHNG